MRKSKAKTNLLYGLLSKLLQTILYRRKNKQQQNKKVETIKKESVSNEAVKRQSPKNGDKTFKCHLCEMTTKRRNNLKRHIQRFHGNSREAAGPAESGNCLCLECGYRCQQVKDLRKHLMNLHEQEFQTEEFWCDDKGIFFV